MRRVHPGLESTPRNDEMMLLAIALDDEAKAVDICHRVKPEQLRLPRHRSLLRLIADYIANQRPLDIPALSREPILKACGGFAYVMEITDRPTRGIYLDGLIGAITLRYQQQEAIALFSAAIKAARGESAEFASAHLPTDLPSLLTAAGEHLARLADPAVEDTLQFVDAYEEAEQRIRDERNEERASRMTTGIRDWDARLNGGIRRRKLGIIGGMTGMGKTALGATVGVSMAADGLGVLTICSEQDRAEYAQRQMSIVSGIPFERLESDRLLGDPRIEEAKAERRDWKLWNRSPDRFDLTGIVSTTMRLVPHGLDCVIIDYLQLMDLPSSETTAEAFGQVTKVLKQMAKKLSVSVILLMQLNRQFAGRLTSAAAKERWEWDRLDADAWWSGMPLPDHRSDLAGSSGPANDADYVWFPLRASEMHIAGAPRDASCIVQSKCRNGKLGIVPTRFVGATMTFAQRR